MAWDEWEQLKQDAADRHTSHTKLDKAGGDGPQGDLTVYQKDLAAVGDAAYRLYTAFSKWSSHAKHSSQAAAGGLGKDGYALGAALGHVTGGWDHQAQTLKDACAHISNHLDYTRNAHAGDEVYIAHTISSISQLDKGFDERTQH